MGDLEVLTDIAGILAVDREFRDVLSLKGHDVDCHEFAGGHNCANWRGTFTARYLRGHEVTVSASTLSPGVYAARLTSGRERESVRFIHLR